MPEHNEHQPGDIILHHYLPDATSEQREEARAQLHAFIDWQMRIIMRQMREEADSRRTPQGDTLDSAPPPP